ncbi:MAG: glycosyltransferase family 4 protein [Candidatus Azambacteria bacterium]|nr:glycosyltransferase family 4 protein [Candidatus Azambacteria bacterium]
MPAKRVLIFSLAYLPFAGGAELALRQITDRIDDIEFDLITLRFDRNLPRVERVGNITVYRVGYSRWAPTARDLMRFPLYLTKVFFAFSALSKAVRLHRTRHYDALWAMMSYAGIPAALFKLWYSRIPFLLTLQEGDSIAHITKRWRIKMIWPLYRLVFKRATLVQAISRYLGEFALAMGYGGPVEVIPNGVDIALFGKDISESEQKELRKSLGLKEGDRCIVTTSRLVEKNAIDDIIMALRDLDTHIKLLMPGTGPCEEQLRLVAKKYGLGARARFFGHVDIKEIPKYLAVSDVFCRPSLSEGFGSSFVEAMAAGIPVVATPVGGIVDFLFDPEKDPEKEPTGLFCNVRDPKSIAQKVQQLLSDDALRARIVANARKLAKEKYNWDLIAKEMQEKVFNIIIL